MRFARVRAPRAHSQGHCRTPSELPDRPQPLYPTQEAMLLILFHAIRLLINDYAALFFAVDNGWRKGNAGQTCNEVCEAIGMACDSNKQSSITSRSKMQAALVAAGYEGCSSYRGGRSYAGAPFIARGDCYSFAPNKGGYAPANEAKYDNSVCDRNTFSHHMPLCYCTKGKLHLSTRVWPLIPTILFAGCSIQQFHVHEVQHVTDLVEKMVRPFNYTKAVISTKTVICFTAYVAVGFIN